MSSSNGTSELHGWRADTIELTGIRRFMGANLYACESAGCCRSPSVRLVGTEGSGIDSELAVRSLRMPIKPTRLGFCPHVALGFALVASAFACAPNNPSPPPRTIPPTPPPAHSQAPLSQPRWVPRPDPRARAEREGLNDCGNERVAAFNELEEENERAVTLLLEAASCYEQAGGWGHAIKVLLYVRKVAPERAEAEDVDYRVKMMYRSFVSHRDAAATLHARACGATIIDPPPEASARALIEVATCLERDRVLLVLELRYRLLAATRGAGADNAARIEVIEKLQKKVEQVVEIKGY